MTKNDNPIDCYYYLMFIIIVFLLVLDGYNYIC